jgi:molybdate transport system substrate-binding protein
MRRIALPARMAVFSLLFAGFALTARADETPALRVFAAASLTEVLQDIAADYTKTGAASPLLSFAASSALARQIEAGAPADVFVSADEEWMDYLAARDLIRTTSRRPIAGNRLALIAPAGSTLVLPLVRGVDFVAALHGGRLATADPDSVPAGRYARSALMSLNAWPALADRLARAENVRMALAYVARGEAPLGIVYATDAQIEPRVRVLGLFPENTHLPILYPAAALRDAPAGADGFLRFLAAPQALERLRQRGFTTVPAPAEASR